MLYQVRWLDRAQLYSMWPGHAVDIKAAPTDRPEWTTITQQLGDPVRVVEAWYLDLEATRRGGTSFRLRTLSWWTSLRVRCVSHRDFPP